MGDRYKYYERNKLKRLFPKQENERTKPIKHLD